MLPPYPLARWALFKLPPEKAQKLAEGYLHWASGHARALTGLSHYATRDERLEVEALGARFPNPLGAAGGMDKNAATFPALHALGFGHVEVGTVTPLPQQRNPGKTLWRAVADEALVNALGFPNEGLEAAAARLAAGPHAAPIGVNVGPNRDALDRLDEQLATLIPRLAGPAAFVTINLSSPNTKGLRGLAEPATIAKTVSKALGVMDDADCRRPLLVKLSPDSTDEQITGQCRAAMDAGASGIVATNTTTVRPDHLTHLDRGGLSGAPLRARSTEVVRLAASAVADQGIVIGVGGIHTGRDAAEKLAAGATLVQAYTGMVYRGPGFPGLVCRELLAEMDRLGVDGPDELRGLDPANITA